MYIGHEIRNEIFKGVAMGGGKTAQGKGGHMENILCTHQRTSLWKYPYVAQCHVK